MKNIDDTLKEEINSGGFECLDDESGCALLIGRAEEMPALREKLYSDGHAADLGSYIRMHKKVVLPFEEVSKNTRIRDWTKKNIGCVFSLKTECIGENTFVTPSYVDKNMNIVNFRIDPSKIASFKDAFEYKCGELYLQYGKLMHLFKIESEQLGFKEGGTCKEDYSAIQEIEGIIGSYNRVLQERIQSQAKKEFDF